MGTEGIHFVTIGGSQVPIYRARKNPPAEGDGHAEPLLYSGYARAAREELACGDLRTALSYAIRGELWRLLGPDAEEIDLRFVMENLLS